MCKLYFFGVKTRHENRFLDCTVEIIGRRGKSLRQIFFCAKCPILDAFIKFISMFHFEAISRGGGGGKIYRVTNFHPVVKNLPRVENLFKVGLKVAF